jgi:hypothetical protein
MSSPSVTRVTRRRQRSTRVSVAVGLILIAALGVTSAALAVGQADASWLLVTAAGLLAVALGAAAVRILHTELVDSRRAAATDRAQLAREYADLATDRVDEHTSYVTAMVDRIAAHEKAIEELGMAVSAAQRRTANAVRARKAETERAEALQAQLVSAEDRATDAMVRIAEIEAELETLRTELEAVTAAWHAAEGRRRHA